MSDAKKIGLVGHCGPDSSFLRMAVSSALPGAKVIMIDSDATLKLALEGEVDLLLFNRMLEFGFNDRHGLPLMRSVLAAHPEQAVMMVSNYDDAQQAAEDAGAMPGFGKNEIGSDKVSQRLRSAVGLDVSVA